MYQHRDVEQIEKLLNEYFENACEWFVDNNLSIHFGEVKPNLFFWQVSLKSKVQEK